MSDARIFFSASQEHFPPEELLRQAVAAAQAGFEGISSSDHLQPWWEPGESGHTWPWLGAVGATVEDLPIGTAVDTRRSGSPPSGRTPRASPPSTATASGVWPTRRWPRR